MKALDIGGSIGFAKDFCINGEVKTVFSVDPDGEFIREFLDCNNDSRFKITEDNTENVDFSKFKYDIAFLILILPWLTEPAALIKKIASSAPNNIVISNHELGPDQKKIFGGRMSPLNDKIKDIFKKYRSKELCIADILTSNGYNPLNVRKYKAFSAVLYT